MPTFLYSIVLAFVTAFLVTYFVLPKVIEIALAKGLTDEPGERRSHKVSTPNLGGVGIFMGLLLGVIAWTPSEFMGNLQYILCACFVVFLIGVKDDIIPTAPRKKVYGQLIAAAILIWASDLRIPGLYGIGGIEELPYWISVLFTAFTVIVIINAFNLIDGVNGLTGTITIVGASALGIWFYLAGHPEYTLLAAGLIGAILAFLKYNWTPARVFMGDTGSLLLGLLMAILTIRFLQFHLEVPTDRPYYLPAAPATAIGFLIVPLFDTLRVFTTRIVRGRSPFTADRNHIHHLLTDLHLSHGQTTGILAVIAVLFVVLVLMLQNLGNLGLITLIIALALLGTFSLQLQLKRRAQAREEAQQKMGTSMVEPSLKTDETQRKSLAEREISNV